MASRTRIRVSSVIPGLSLMTAETVWMETFASLATSIIVTLVGDRGGTFTAKSCGDEPSCERSSSAATVRCQCLGQWLGGGGLVASGPVHLLLLGSRNFATPARSKRWPSPQALATSHQPHRFENSCLQ